MDFGNRRIYGVKVFELYGVKVFEPSGARTLEILTFTV